MNYSRVALTTLLLLSFRMLPAQSISTTITNYFDQVRQNAYPAQPRSLWQEEAQHTEVLAALTPYYSDTLAQVRAKAYYLAKQVGTSSQKLALRQRVTEQLVAGLSDEDSGNAGRVNSYLTEFRPVDFTAKAQQQLANLLLQRPAHFSQLLLLVGTLGMQDQTSVLQRMLPSLSGRHRWSAQLALARMGDQEALTDVLARVKRYPVNDDVVYELLPDLVYTRQKEAIDYLAAIVQSDERNCQSADPEAEEPILCGYRVLELLAPIIENFPLALDESGDLAVNDYPAALQQARRWLSQHPNYQIANQ